MKRFLLNFVFAVLLTSGVFGQTTYEFSTATQTIHDCSAIIYDLDDADGTYQHNKTCEIVVTIPDVDSIIVEFSFIDIIEAADNLKFYKGVSEDISKLVDVVSVDDNTDDHKVIRIPGNELFLKWITDANDTDQGFQFTYTGILNITRDISEINSVSCNGDTDGRITLNPAVAGIYDYTWGDIADPTANTYSGNSLSLTDLSPDTYIINVENSGGCIKDFTITITEPDILVVGNTINKNVSCFGQNDGSANINVTGGTLPYTYVWSDNPVTNVDHKDDLIAGAYIVTVTDTHGCTDWTTFNITQPGKLNATKSADPVLNCNGDSDGEVTITVAGGVPPYKYDWPSGIDDVSVRSNLIAGTYIVTVSDDNSCATTITAIVTQPSVVSASYTINQNVKCKNGTDGDVSIFASGGTESGTYDFTWSAIGSGSSCVILEDGTYTVTATDDNGCSGTTSFTITEPATSISATNTVLNDVSCNGGSNGKAIINAIGGTVTSGYSYNWPSGSDIQTRTDLSSGDYIVTVVDDNNCSATTTVSISQPAKLNIDTTILKHVTCFGESNGSVKINVTGGTPPFTYQWSDVATVNVDQRNDLKAGTYDITVTDAKGCTDQTSVVIDEPAALTASSSVDLTVKCNGGSDGKVTITVAGGVGSYSYDWPSGTDDVAVRSDLTAGSYTVTVTDDSLCVATVSATVSQPTAVSVGYIINQNVKCKNGTDGDVSISTSGGTEAGTYDFTWSAIGFGASCAILEDGTYTVSATDDNGCTGTTTFTITEPATSISATNTVLNDVSCNGGSNGKATINAIGGTVTSGYSYNWPSGSNVQTRTDLSSGDYIVTVVDDNNCSATTTVSISQPTNALSAIPTGLVNVKCFGESNGAASLTTTGGTSPYTYKWSDNTNIVYSVNSRTNLVNANYTVTVTDNLGCTYPVNITISQPSQIIPVATINEHVKCSGVSSGKVTISATGGVIATDYTYNWPSGDDTKIRTDLLAGSYIVTVSDDNNCQATVSTTITEPTALVVSPQVLKNVNCKTESTGQATILASGGTVAGSYIYNWPTGSDIQIRNDLAAGSYDVTVTDDNSCSGTVTVSISEPATSVSASVSGIKNVTCFGLENGEATVNGSNGTAPLTYKWSDNSGLVYSSGTRTNLRNMNYSVTVTDNNGCNVVVPANISQPALLVANISAYTTVTQYGKNDGSATVSGTGGTGVYSYSWNTFPVQNTAIASNLTKGVYIARIVDQNGCSDTASVFIKEPTLLVGGEVSINGQTYDSICKNSTADEFSNQTLASGGKQPYTYMWQYSTNLTNWEDFASLPATDSYIHAGTFSENTFIRRVVTDANSVSAYSNIIKLYMVDTLQVSISGMLNSYCENDESFQITANPAPTVGASGVFTSITGLTDNGDGSASIDPLTLVVDGSNKAVITYTYTNKYCVSRISKTITVNDTTQISTSLKTSYGIADDDVSINPSHVPAIIYGTGVNPVTYMFSPKTAKDGVHTITYLYSNANKCTSTLKQSVSVINTGGSFVTSTSTDLFTRICRNAPSVIIVAKPDLKPKVGSSKFILKTGSLEIDTLLKIDDLKADFSPADLSEGTYTLYYSYIDEITDNNVFFEQNFDVIDVGDVSMSINSLTGVQFCRNDDPVQITITSSNSTGTFTGNGVTTLNSKTALFSPSASFVGDNTITYTSNKLTCSVTIDTVLRVNPLPNITSITYKKIFNIDEPAFPLSATADKPGTGSFVGTGVYESKFDPQIAKVGTFSLKYNYTDTDGCKATFQGSIQVMKNELEINVPATNNTYCYSDKTIQLTDTIFVVLDSVIGTFSGKGITQIANTNKAVFSLTQAGKGDHQIKFSYKLDLKKESYDTARFFVYTNILVDTIPEITFSGLSSDFCIDHNDVELFGNPATSALDGGFSGEGIIKSGSRIRFSPSSVVEGEKEITYIYTSGISACKDSVKMKTKVHSLPQIQSISYRKLYNINEKDIILRGVPEGKFSGTGIIDDSVFTPIRTGVNNLVFQVIDSNSCSNSQAFSVIVADTRGSILPAGDLTYCYTDFDATLTGIPDTMNVIGVFEGKGIIDNGNNTATFSPVLAGAGNHIIRFSYKHPIDSIAIFVVEKTITVDSIGLVEFDDIDSTHCISESQFKLPVVNDRTDGIHEFSGIDVAEALTTLNKKTALVNPQKLTPGDYVVTYTYTSMYGCVASIDKNIRIDDLPSVSFTPKSLMNVNAEPQLLKAIPSGKGGSFSGVGVIEVNDSVFYFEPSGADLEENNEILFTYVDSNGCENSTTAFIYVQSSEASIVGNNKNYCFDGMLDTIWAYSTNGIAGGTITGKGVVQFDPPKVDTVLYNPVIAGSGNDTIRYTYTGNDGVTQSTIYTVATVSAEVSIKILGLNQTDYCNNDGRIVLSAFPENGVFSGKGVEGISFYPDKADIGVNVIKYDYPTKITLSDGKIVECISKTDTSVVVHESPNVYFTGLNSIKSYCANSNFVELIGSHVSGIYSANVITDTKTYINPANLKIGQNVISYYYKEPITGCANTFYDTVTIFQIPSLRILTIEDEYCRKTGDHVISGEVIGIEASAKGKISGAGIYDADSTDGIAIFNPDSVLNSGSYNIKYEYTDTNNCHNYQVKSIIVNDLPIVSLNGYSKFYCESNQTVTLSGLPSGFTGVYTIDNVSGSNWNKLSLQVPGQHSVSYEYTDNKGCVNEYFDIITVYASPEVDINGFNSDKAYCANDPYVYLYGDPSGGVFSANVVSADAKDYISPENLKVGYNYISYYYKDEVTGCSNTTIDTVTIYQLPSLRILGLDEDLCRKSGDKLISGEVIGLPPSTVGMLSGNGVYDEYTTDGVAVFNPDSVLDNSSIVRFEYRDTNNCHNFITKEIIINELPVVSLSGYDLTYCQGEEIISLSGSPFGPTSMYTIDNVSGISWNKLQVNVPGKHSISYEFTDANSCSNILFDTITIYAAPKLSFSIKDECMVDSIIFINKTISEEPIKKWEWNFGDAIDIQNNVSDLMNPKHLYSISGAKIVTLRVTTASECSFSKDSIINLGTGPTADFTFKNECFGDEVNFKSTSLGEGIENYQWDFADGSTSDTSVVSHKFDAIGSYKVKLKVSTFSQCSDEVEKTVNIRPYIVPHLNEAYSEDFEINNGSWFAKSDNDINTWQY